MSNRTALKRVMPAMLLHDGWWDGWYRHFDAEGALLDQHKVKTHCEFPDEGDWHYIQHNWLTWENGESAVYEFGGKLDGSIIRWDTEGFRGYGWQTGEDSLMLMLDRLDVPGSYYIEMINVAPAGETRARTWQWFKDGKPWKRTLCDEWRIEGP